MNYQQIKKILNSEAGAELKRYLTEELIDLRSIDNVKEYSKGVDQAIELKACKKAYKKLKEILDRFATIENIREIEVEKGNDYGL